MQIREPSGADLGALLAFFERVPESERTFFKEPVLDRPTVEGWLTGERGRRGLALADDGRVVGDGDGGHRRRARVNCQAIRVGK